MLNKKGKKDIPKKKKKKKKNESVKICFCWKNVKGFKA
jgi:hypothetical protein